MLSNLLLLPGDGIGQEVMQAALPLFELLVPNLPLIQGDIGWEFWLSENTPIPQRTWDLIHQADAILLGATTSKRVENEVDYLSPILQLRQKLELYANVRPCFQINKSGKPFDFIIIRENTEGLYAGLDFSPLPSELENLMHQQAEWSFVNTNNASIALRVQTEKGLKRIFNYAFNYAEVNHRKKITLADKPNVLRKSANFAKKCFEAIAKNYPLIEVEIMNVDAVAFKMIKNPSEFDVIVSENMFGDILSDVGAGIMGSLGLPPSANIGDKYAYFEPVHGSAPQMKKNKANPSALFLSIAMMFKHCGYLDFSAWIEQAVLTVIHEKKWVTYDLNGKATCQEMAREIINHVKKYKDR